MFAHSANRKNVDLLTIKANYGPVLCSMVERNRLGEIHGEWMKLRDKSKLKITQSTGYSSEFNWILDQ